MILAGVKAQATKWACVVASLEDKGSRLIAKKNPQNTSRRLTICRLEKVFEQALRTLAYRIQDMFAIKNMCAIFDSNKENYGCNKKHVLQILNQIKKTMDVMKNMGCKF